MIHVQQFLFVVLAVFWAWSTFRYAFERLASPLFSATRVFHPLLVAGGTVYFCWPDTVMGLAAAGAVGLLVATTDRLFQNRAVTPVRAIGRRTGQGLPDLP